MTRVRLWCVIYLSQALYYALLCWGIVAISEKQLASILIADVVTSFVNYFVLSEVVAANQYTHWRTKAIFSIAFALGGAFGSVIAVFLLGGR